MNLITAGLLLAGCILVQADSEAFFLSSLLSPSRSSRSGVRTHHQPPQRRPRTRPLSHPPASHQHHHTRHGGPIRPTRQIKSIFPPQIHGRHNNVRAPKRIDPGRHMRLDFGGWKAINFDENLPAKLKRGIKIEDLKSLSESVKSTGKIVTIDTAIATAPTAESDDIHDATAVAAVPPPYIPSTADHTDHNSVIYVDSSNAPIYNVLEANNPAIAPRFEPSKPVFQSPQYIPRPAVPSKPYKPQPPALAPQYEPVPQPIRVSVSKPKYEPKPAVPPAYQPQPAPAPAYQPQPAPAPAYEPQPAPAPAYEEPKQAILPAFTPAPNVDNEKYPIVALITADSDVPENEKYVQFSINGGSPDSLPAITDDIKPNTRQPKEVAKDVTKESDELYYIYYQDPELDPSFGVKIQSERDTKYLGLDIPLYDYDEAADVYRSERSQPSFGAKSSSSVSFKQNVGGKKSAFTYQLS